ncbi:subtilisin-like serine peptidase [Ectocarpus siliculosus]|uniref:subtilisin n=1 Tax=Ectocarpus siliculosus TaxID=2880 RepID=D8LU20_ECTSI|nr:subtilisin-like serine peptidase [Ectocarpus siliculosus]|eukprot:CBN75410.1 subtilisin-like serine peptidase [Ectocarpus siliculosus]
MGLRADHVAAILLVASPSAVIGVDLGKIQTITASSAFDDFARSQSAYSAASKWHTKRLAHAPEGSRAPYIACADYKQGRHAMTSLETAFTESAVHRVSNTETDGSCFIVTALPSSATAMISAPEDFALLSAAPFLPSLKLATRLLDHGPDTSPHVGAADDFNLSDLSAPLRSTYGEDRSQYDVTRVREWSRAAAVVDSLASKRAQTFGEICGFGKLSLRHVADDLLLVEGMNHLLPGKKAPSEARTACYMGLLSQLAAKPEVLRVSPLQSASLYNAVANALVQSATTTETPLLDAGLDGTGEVIQVVDTGLDETSCFFADDDGLQVEHGFLFGGVRVEGDGNVSTVLGNYSFPFDMSRRKIVQYIQMFKTPDQGSTSSGQNSFTYASDYIRDYLGDAFDDDDSEYNSYDDYSGEYSSDTWSEESFCAQVLDDLSYHFSSLFDDTSYSPSSASSSISSTGGFDKDIVGGHGTWTAGCAAGAISAQSSLQEEACYGDELPGCAGGCISASDVDAMLDNGSFDLDVFCPMYNCDGNTDIPSSECLSDDPVENLHQHGGVAPGAQISMLDASYTGSDSFALFAGNMLWYSAMETGAKIHSNSWGYDMLCQLTENEYLYDSFMYENPEHLLIFAAGNHGGNEDIPNHEGCTIGSPALGKNILAVGATSSGPSRGTRTGEDGNLVYEEFGMTDYSPEGYPWICLSPSLGTPSASMEPAGVDTVAFFSSQGPTLDGRIKPDVVAPGDQVASASSDGTDGHSCRLLANMGTSASCPLVAGAAALVRQYFKDPSFFAKDVTSRGGCAEHSSSSQCSEFAPSAATVKAMIINSAHLMGGSSEPNGLRGFGRVHLEAGMPMDGVGETGLLVVEATIGSDDEITELVTVDGDAGAELRATLAWLDPPTTALSAKQLQHDLDLHVIAPSGAKYTMWESGADDTVNVVERVIVPVESMESGVWSVVVSAKGLLTDEQSYSLVVTGAIYSSK